MPYKDPAARKTYERRYRDTHREERREAQRRWHEANRASHSQRGRARRYRVLYGIAVEEYDRMLAAQNGCCAICRTDQPRGRGRFHVDHDHKTGKVRGLLCHLCNTALGRIEKYDAWKTYLGLEEGGQS